MTADLTPREMVARALGESGAFGCGCCAWAEDRDLDADDPRAATLARAALTALADHPGLVEVLARALREHQPTTGMSVASGVTCRCGYWNGNEVSGTTRPVGYQGLQWHQAHMQADVIRAWLRGAS